MNIVEIVKFIDMMDIFLAYITTFFIIFIMMPLTYFILRFVIWLFMDFCHWGGAQTPNPPNPNRRLTFSQIYDRQGNIFTIADDPRSGSGAHRCTDFFYVESSGDDAARIRAQLEKDDKDLPTYDEVMGLGAGSRNLSSLPAVTAGSTAALGASTASIATTETVLNVPPYSEVDPYANVHSTTTTPATAANRGNVVPPIPSAMQHSANAHVTAIAGATASTSASEGAPSTSRAAASTSSSVVNITAVASQTSV